MRFFALSKFMLFAVTMGCNGVQWGAMGASNVALAHCHDDDWWKYTVSLTNNGACPIVSVRKQKTSFLPNFPLTKQPQ
jgi:hypothetical protein